MIQLSRQSQMMEQVDREDIQMKQVGFAENPNYDDGQLGQSSADFEVSQNPLESKQLLFLNSQGKHP